VQGAQAPLTLANAEDFQMWDLTLEEVTRYTLANSQVIRQLGGRISDGGLNISATAPELLSQTNGANATTTYDPAIVESGNGTGAGGQLGGVGVEAALSEFDATLDNSIFWRSNDRPQNFQVAGLPDFLAPNFRQELSNFTLGITKVAADGTQFEIRNNTNYDQNNNGSRQAPSDWTTNFEVAFARPLLQGGGTQYNRIAGVQSFQQSAAGFANSIDGVVIARIRHDVSLADFEAGVHNLMRDVEDAYWELYFAYRDLEARKIGRDSALETWRRIKALQRAGQAGGEANQEAQARSQYYLFRSQVETALTNLFRVENRLRYMMGLSVSDGRLIRPIDEPTTAQVYFEWSVSHTEALARRVEVRRKKWDVKRRELELIAARNHLLPRLDGVGRYRWLGAGDELIDSSSNGARPFLPGSNAFDVLTSGDYQEWELGLQFSLPIGFRRAMTGVRHHQLLLARERALLEDIELEISHQLGDAIRDADLNYGVAQTNFNRRAAAEDEVEAVQAVYDVGRVTLDLLLDAQRRRAEAESSYYRSLVDYNRAIMRVHHRKGSLLEYNGVYLAEGPWPGKAYFDALRNARGRDAAIPLKYGYTRPNVMSQGPFPQMMGSSSGQAPANSQGAPVPEEVTPEALPADAATLPLEVSAAGATSPLPSPLPAAGGESLRYAAPMQYVTPVQYAAPLPQSASVSQAAQVPPVEPLPAVETGW
jgi:outer membrane protein TolC